jgi:hypothetical protein
MMVVVAMVVIPMMVIPRRSRCGHDGCRKCTRQHA